MAKYYRRDGTPCEMLEWAESFENPELKIVAQTELPEGEVSTVWLGLDHQFGDGPPLIFETMVFGGELDQECERYSTEEEAKAGHERWIQKVQRTAKD